MKRLDKKLSGVTILGLWLGLAISGSGAELGTRQRTIRPAALPAGTPAVVVTNIPAYEVYGYSAWEWGPGEDAGRRFLRPAEYTEATHAARLLSFFAIADIHITDKESPSQSLYTSYQSQTGDHGNSSCYSPVILYTTHVLDAAIRTINGLQRLTPFDFGISLGDNINGSQYNELRWFIDVMDGKFIQPSSGTNAGAATIDYQKPYQAAGLDRSIPWYQVLGNHDHFWLGAWPVTDYLRQSYTNNEVLLMGDLIADGVDSRKAYLGTIDGGTPYGTVIGAGPVTNFIVAGVTNAPKIAPDPRRYSLTRSNWMREFFETTSTPVGHGFSLANVTNDFACYSFEPKASLPLKVIALDDTMTDETFDIRGHGSLDMDRFNWLTRELQTGQDAGQLMIIAAHVPLELVGYGASTNSAVSKTALLAALHQYPNLILWIAGHAHRNRVIPQPSPDPACPENGFWEVWAPSLRDFPRQFVVVDLLRNHDNTLSIVTTVIDPEAAPGSPAATALGHAVAASRIFSNPSTNLTDTASYAYNAELVKVLSPAMRAKIADCGQPPGHRVAVDRTGSGARIEFLGRLQSAAAASGPWTDITDSSPYPIPAPSGAKFYRSVE